MQHVSRFFREEHLVAGTEFALWAAIMALLLLIILAVVGLPLEDLYQGLLDLLRDAFTGTTLSLLDAISE